MNYFIEAVSIFLISCPVRAVLLSSEGERHSKDSSIVIFSDVDTYASKTETLCEREDYTRKQEFSSIALKNLKNSYYPSRIHNIIFILLIDCFSRTIFFFNYSAMFYFRCAPESQGKQLIKGKERDNDGGGEPSEQ